MCELTSIFRKGTGMYLTLLTPSFIRLIQTYFFQKKIVNCELNKKYLNLTFSSRANYNFCAENQYYFEIYAFKFFKSINHADLFVILKIL